jgi:hypothetical protein
MQVIILSVQLVAILAPLDLHVQEEQLQQLLAEQVRYQMWPRLLALLQQQLAHLEISSIKVTV